jgi:hypothetical protein
VYDNPQMGQVQIISVSIPIELENLSEYCKIVFVSARGNYFTHYSNSTSSKALSSTLSIIAIKEYKKVLSTLPLLDFFLTSLALS